jgi:serine phosphatase RsbU (regulator of sigma subunit)/anti-anti-sigma regulatory factor
MGVTMTPRILAVDDEPGILTLVKRVLERDGLHVDTAKSGKVALEALKTSDFDVIIVDLSMPEMDGFTMLDWLRENRPHIVSLILSGTTRIEDAIEALRRGAYDFVTKPIVEYAVFVQQVQRAIKFKRLQDRNTQLVSELQEKNIELENQLGQLEMAHNMLQSQAMATQADLNHARAIQLSQLPRELPFWDRLSLSALYWPAAKVGGDFFNIFQLDDQHLGFYVADTTGHGVSAALVTVFLKDAVESVEIIDGQPVIVEPGHLLRRLNKRLFEENFGQDLFVSMFYLILNVDTLELRYASAGHPPLLLRHEDGQIERLRESSPALGINLKVKYTTAQHTLSAKDSICIYTDGVSDVVNGTGELFGEDRFTARLTETSGPPALQVKTIEDDLIRFSETEAFPDDITLLILQFQGQENAAIDLHMQPNESVDTVVPLGPQVLTATDEDSIFVNVTGSGTWRESRHVLDMTEEALKSKRSYLILDFTRCTHLDSTFLGVLHNVCTRADEEGSLKIQLQNLTRPLLKDMSELGLTNVLLHFNASPRPIPESMGAVKQGTSPDAEMGRLLLEAHEALVRADPDNADRFAAVLKVLHQQAGKHLHGAPTEASVTDQEEQ